MNNISFEKELVSFLNIPSVPRKEFDGKTPFDKGVAVLKMRYERYAYAVCAYNPERGDKEPRIVKTFGVEPFVGIEKIFVVPSYMSTEEEIKDMDLDDESKKKAEQILKEAAEIENDGVEEENPMDNLPEWIFEEINSKEEAIAWLKNFQSRNKMKGRIPTTDENIKLRLYSIYTELQNKQK